MVLRKKEDKVSFFLLKDSLEELIYFLLPLIQGKKDVLITYKEKEEIEVYRGKIKRMDSSNQTLYLHHKDQLLLLHVYKILEIEES